MVRIITERSLRAAEYSREDGVNGELSWALIVYLAVIVRCHRRVEVLPAQRDVGNEGSA